RADLPDAPPSPPAPESRVASARAGDPSFARPVHRSALRAPRQGAARGDLLAPWSLSAVSGRGGGRGEGALLARNPGPHPLRNPGEEGRDRERGLGRRGGRAGDD